MLSGLDFGNVETDFSDLRIGNRSTVGVLSAAQAASGRSNKPDSLRTSQKGCSVIG